MEMKTEDGRPEDQRPRTIIKKKEAPEVWLLLLAVAVGCWLLLLPMCNTRIYLCGKY